jgi:hypothetical protein
MGKGRWVVVSVNGVPRSAWIPEEEVRGIRVDARVLFMYRLCTAFTIGSLALFFVKLMDKLS